VPVLVFPHSMPSLRDKGLKRKSGKSPRETRENR
jgi:hypothetical protein